MEDFIISNEYDGCIRKLYKCICLFCSKEFRRPKHILHKSACCSKECYYAFKKTNSAGSWIEVTCNNCNKLCKKYIRHLKKSKSGNVFCSRACQSYFLRKGKQFCINCNKKLIGKQKEFCSHNCHQYHKNLDRIKEWQLGNIKGIDEGEQIKSWLRKYLIEKYGNKCSLCGWSEINPTTGKIPIQVDHMDGDYKNNKEENLRILCPNCHSLTPTYGSLNSGKGREKRRIKLQNHKKYE